ncbi:uncharacterized protein MONOS_1719 [Monocercomonoides exilis]|uniref:uncharacterized protein n=1 Tax=Monocercomonoides exilis TaxID=2049356 RepID=UPI00355A8815|nr:hypothetical protein MONOS_1719 [Monocercomonoides exilis]|eukprot:MONOS_1719.1-p1 / transcript=MONOS_1719.1 / gene=MONOS_1719 / organism=Monocercomonoides_exilis_PA203 / gene_product=unspecified product / transcript_product=unspecified product / location=Mono_scaffold00032:12255-13714(+) / protein_length=443 / sequence_SO=supercontig / SO=protein_coding / is_pseudo=false
MSLFDDYDSENELLTTARTKKFSKLFCELEHRTEDEQKQKIEELNRLIDEMNEGEFITVFTKDLYNKIHQMIEEKTLSWGNAILLLKHAGFCKVLKKIPFYSFDYSSLSKRMKEMIIDENEKKKEEKNEKRLIDLCECFAWLNEDFISKELFSVIVPRLLKVASKKDENEETQKEAKMNLLTLCRINTYTDVPKELYLSEVKEIIKYHQEHSSLTHLIYQYIWQFLIYGLLEEESFEEVVVNELHFVGETRRELEELSKCIDWKRKEERRKEVKEVKIIGRWLLVIDDFLNWCRSWNEELAGLICSIVQVFRASRDNYKEILNGCLSSLRRAVEKRNVKIDDLLKSGAIGLYLEEMKQSTLEDGIISDCLHFFLKLSERLKEKKDEEKEEAKRKEMKRKIFEKMEEEGFEDITTSLYGVISFLNKNCYRELSKNTSDYFVNV